VVGPVRTSTGGSSGDRLWSPDGDEVHAAARSIAPTTAAIRLILAS
jgi:hypothetical protein